ncbi:isochorismate synthase [Hymenobacter roseosalivarius DSM 11622]|uniref:Isochorismate synthase n=1 Tax=Hymenobacter roseosalivarius DSM 11622 TaxID=645990 RepID=A0A1W1VYQ4_9BACT|nr:chorismate-binding protein [Hymenobacter roseosalivarius]SMB97974.1 isochorismate synthase [Hymenobacter roseosalivarius DSM 11622]
MSQPHRPTLVPYPGGGQLSAAAQVRRLVAFALQTGLPVALWRLPGTTHAQLCLSFSAEEALTGLPPNLEPGAPAGFAFFPFRDSDHNPALFLPANVFFDTKHAGQFWVNKTGPADFRLTELRQFLQAAPATASLLWHQSLQPAPATASPAEYAALVRRGLAAIEQGAVQKVVSSRAVRRNLPPGFDALLAFEELQARYPQAFVSLVSAPGAGTWLGATPEVLAEVTPEGIFRTMALAGTQPLTPGLTPQKAIWRQKEIEEQALVARYIVSCFKQLRLREYDEIGPRTVVAGELLHLRTDFAVHLRQVPFPSLGTDMLRLLHPTSAVGGMPRQAALDFLQQYEGYDRAYYSGFLGPVNLPQAGVARLFVNLRCMQLRPTEAILYAGTGLTIDSDPEREWEETELKLRTAGAVLDG